MTVVQGTDDFKVVGGLSHVSGKTSILRDIEGFSVESKAVNEVGNVQGNAILQNNKVTALQAYQQQIANGNQILAQASGEEDLANSIPVGQASSTDVISSAKGSGQAQKGEIISGVNSDLRASEVKNGHTLREHVGKTDQEILDRSASKGGKAVSSYPDEGTAQTAVNENMKANQEKISNFMNNPNQTREILEHDHGKVVGRGTDTGSTVVEDQIRSKVVIAKHGNGSGSFVLTSHPIK